jgi:flagellar hook-basal body complex protein FliE
MGAVDFVTKEREAGSAKYYQNANAAEQALSGFVDMYNQKYPNSGERTDSEGNPKRVEVRYVIAAKKQDVGQMGSPTRGTSDPSKIIGAEIYTPLVSFYIEGDKAFAQIKRGNEYSENLKIKEGQIKIGAGLTEADSLGMLYITTTRTSTFKEMINTSMEKQEEDAKNAFKEFQNYFEELRTASESAKKYIAGGEISDGNKTYQSLEKAETSFSVVVTNLDYGDKVSTDPSTGAASISSTRQQVAESKKITAKHLQKLISEKFKK